MTNLNRQRDLRAGVQRGNSERVGGIVTPSDLDRQQNSATGFQRGGSLDRVGAAGYLSISTRKLDDLLSLGEIKRIKLGRKTLIRVMDLDKFLARLAGEEGQ